MVKFILSAVVAAFVAGSATADINTATVVAHGYSFNTDLAQNSNGSSTLFSTYDGGSGYPLHWTANGLIYSTGEFKPVSLGSQSYIADYIAGDSSGIYEYGSASIFVSKTDANGNGVIDGLEEDQLGSFGFSGSLNPRWNAFGLYQNSTISGATSRSAGTHRGTYAGSTTHPIAGTTTFSGAYSLSGSKGQLTYNPAEKTFTVDLDYIVPPDDTTTLYGESSYIVNSTESITVLGATVREVPSGFSMTTKAFTLNRSGSIYRGELELVDGNPESNWADYTNYRVEITDLNDGDQDGIPDLSDPVEAPEPSPHLAMATALISLAALRRRHH